MRFSNYEKSGKLVKFNRRLIYEVLGIGFKEIWLLKKNGSISILYKNTEDKQ